MMRKLKLILFSLLLLALCWFPLSHNALAVSLAGNEWVSAEKSVPVVNQEQLLKNAIAQVEGGIAQVEGQPRMIDEGPWEGMFPLQSGKPWEGLQPKGMNYCFEVGTDSPVAITIETLSGETVAAYASAYHQPDSHGVERQHLEIYYPSEDYPFHYALNRETGPKCSMPFQVVATDIRPAGKKAIHIWNNPRGVLKRGEKGTVQCNFTPDAQRHCDNNEWYWYRR